MSSSSSRRYEILGVGPVLGGLVGVLLAAADGPAVVAGVALVPPAVEHADVRDAVLGGLHAGRTGRLERAAWVVEPRVDTLDEVAPDAHVVVLEDEHAAAQLRRARALEDLLDDALAGPVGRVGLAREDDLQRPLGIPQHPGQAIHVGEQQRRSLVGREPAGEADGHDLRIEGALDLAQDAGRLAVAGELAAQPAVDEQGQLALLAQVRLPQLGPRDALEPIPEAILA